MNISTFAAKAFANSVVRNATIEALKTGAVTVVPIAVAGLAVYGACRIVKWVAE